MLYILFLFIFICIQMGLLLTVYDSEGQPHPKGSVPACTHGCPNNRHRLKGFEGGTQGERRRKGGCSVKLANIFHAGPWQDDLKKAGERAVICQDRLEVVRNLKHCVNASLGSPGAVDHMERGSLCAASGCPRRPEAYMFFLFYAICLSAGHHPAHSKLWGPCVGII